MKVRSWFRTFERKSNDNNTIKNATIVNEGKIFQSDVFIQNGIIQEISENIEALQNK